MNYETLVKIKLQRDLYSELQDHYKSYEKDITEEEFNDLLLTIIQDKIEDVSMEFHDTITESWNDERSRCCARQWFHHLGKRCSHLRMNQTTEYCKIHHNMIMRNERLMFGRYDEPRPIVNEYGTKIIWHDHSFEEQINIIIKYQNYQFQRLIQNKSKS